MKKFKILLLIILLVMLSGCYASSVTTNPTHKGYKAQIESQKRIVKERRENDKYHRKHRRKIKRLQNKKKPF